MNMTNTVDYVYRQVRDENLEELEGEIGNGKIELHSLEIRGVA